MNRERKTTSNRKRYARVLRVGEGLKGQDRADAEQERREFLEACGRFASVTSPTVTLLLSTSLTSDAIANSVRGQRNPR